MSESIETEPSASFGDSDQRSEEMHSTIEAWIDDLVNHVDEAQASEAFQEWLDVQSRFHDYSYRNTLLIKHQCPEAAKVAGYRAWQEEFDRHVQEGESAIWIWAPIITKQCPECGNSPSYHEQSDCEYDETPPTSTICHRPRSTSSRCSTTTARGCSARRSSTRRGVGG